MQTYLTTKKHPLLQVRVIFLSPIPLIQTPGENVI